MATVGSGLGADFRFLGRLAADKYVKAGYYQGFLKDTNRDTIHGISYVADPNTLYENSHKKKQAIDFLQFPRQILEYKAGDCDDLSILYAALLEVLSVETALIPVPGHIYIAVNLDMHPAEAGKIFYNTDDLIFRGEKTLLPLEVTMVKDSFIKAWKEGPAEWRRYEPLKQEGFYPVSEAWKIFEPVGLPGEARGVDIPEVKAVAISDSENDYFGTSVSLRGDFAVIGCVFRDDAATDSGAAYIYTRDSGNIWELQKTLTPSDAAASTYFGAAIAIGNTYALIGATEMDDYHYTHHDLATGKTMKG